MLLHCKTTVVLTLKNTQPMKNSKLEAGTAWEQGYDEIPERVLVRSIMHNKIHFTTKHVCYAHMLASYLTAVQISRLLYKSPAY